MKASKLTKIATGQAGQAGQAGEVSPLVIFSSVLVPAHEWEPWKLYLQKLEKITQEVVRKTELKYSLEERMPSQLELLSLMDECQKLSDQWHGMGKGSISCFYGFFYKICEISQTTFYQYVNLPLSKSKDGFVTLYDAGYKARVEAEYKKTILEPFLAQGGVWKAGRSPIDNITLPTITTKENHSRLLMMNVYKKILLRFLVKKQEEIIIQLSNVLGVRLFEREPEDVKAILKNSILAIKSSGVKSESLAFKLLCQFGKKLENWGQLPSSVQIDLWQRIAVKFSSVSVQDSIFRRFSQFVLEKPGAYFDEQTGIANFDTLTPRRKHFFTQFIGLWSRELRGTSRVIVENQTPIRYVLLPWTRKYNLENIMKGTRVIIRTAHQQESSRLRANQGTYFPFHGMSLHSSGLPEGLKVHDTPIYRCGVPMDANAHSTNEHCDIEKVIREVTALNSRASRSRLPGELYLSVGQNSVTASSVIGTQHTQIIGGTLKDFKIYNELRTNPQKISAIDAEVDIVQVGHKRDAFYLKFTSSMLPTEDFIQGLINLRMSLLEQFGGFEAIDFHLHAIPDEQGKLTVIFAPFSRLVMRVGNIYENLDTGETHMSHNLPVPHLQTTSASGLIAVDFEDSALFQSVVEEGMKVLVRLWDFTAKPGTYQYVVDYMVKHFHYSAPMEESRISAAVLLKHARN